MTTTRTTEVTFENFEELAEAFPTNLLAEIKRLERLGEVVVTWTENGLPDKLTFFAPPPPGH